MKRISKIIALLLALCLLAGMGSACGSRTQPLATITLSDGDEILIYLYPDKAPNTVANFIYLANSGFYDGLIFHRVVENFVIQGGDPNGDGTGGPGYTIEGEFENNGFRKNDIAMEKGVIAMARFSTNGESSAEAYNSAGSQFFILLGNKDSLQGEYAAFGKVIEGMETVNAIAETKTGFNDKPLDPQVMKSVTVETFGVDYPEPEKM